MQHHFRVAQSSVHQMVLNLEMLVSLREPWLADRLIRILVRLDELPYLE